MGQYIDLYKQSDRKKAESLAFDILVTDLLANNKSGPNKVRDIGGHNMEKNAQFDLIPSMFYIFLYVSNKKENVFGDDFYDMCPMILCTGSNVKSVSGINFNFIPNNIRAALLDILTGDFNEFYNDRENDVNDDLKVNNDLGRLLTNDISGVLSYIKMKTNIDISSCIRTYSRKNMLKIRMIEYDQWKYIPFLTFNDSVRGINLAKVQSDFVLSQHK